MQKPPLLRILQNAVPLDKKEATLRVCIIHRRASLRGVPCAYNIMLCVFRAGIGISQSGSAPECSHLEAARILNLRCCFLFTSPLADQFLTSHTHCTSHQCARAVGKCEARVRMGAKWIQNLVTSSHNCFVRRGWSVTHVIFQRQNPFAFSASSPVVERVQRAHRAKRGE